MSIERAIKVSEATLLRIADEIICHERWRQYVSYATDLYGDKAYEIEATTTSQYDDEGGYFDTIESVTVKDRAGNILAFDFSTAFWKQELEGIPEDSIEDNADDIARACWIDLYPTPEPVYFDQEPALSFSEFYAVPKEPNSQEERR